MMKKLILITLALAGGLTFFNYFFVVERCTLHWVEPAPDIVNEPVVLADVSGCPRYEGGKLYMKRVGRREYVIYIETPNGERSPDLAPDYPPVIGNLIRTIQLAEIGFKGHRIRWNDSGVIVTDSARTSKVQVKDLQ